MYTLTMVFTVGWELARTLPACRDTNRQKYQKRNDRDHLHSTNTSADNEESTDAGELFDRPGGEQDEDEDDCGERESPSAMSQRVGFFRSHAKPSTRVIGCSEPTP